MNIHLLVDFVLSLFGLYKSAPLLQDYEKEREALEWYRALNRVYFDILEVVYSSYGARETFVTPDYWLNLSFTQLRRTLKSAQELKFNNELLPFDFDDYVNLNINHERLIKRYPEKRLKILEYRAQIEELFYLKNKGVEGNLSEYDEKDLLYYQELIQKHKDKRGYKEITSNNSTLLFTQHKSNKKSVFMMLEKHKNEWVFKKIMKNELRVEYDDLRAIIYQLRQDIISQKLTNTLQIENNDRKGAYKLTVLA